VNSVIKMWFFAIHLVGRYNLNMKKKILITDDDAAIQRVCKDALEDAGFAVECANDGTEAISCVEALKPDLILLDMLMPDASGWDVLTFLNDKAPAIPVIIMSNVWSPEREAEALHKGASGYIQKTDMSLEDVVKRIERELVEA